MSDLITVDALMIALIGSVVLGASVMILCSVAIAGLKRIPLQPATRFDWPTEPQ